MLGLRAALIGMYLMMVGVMTNTNTNQAMRMTTGDSILSPKTMVEEVSILREMTITSNKVMNVGELTNPLHKLSSEQIMLGELIHIYRVT